MSDRTPKLANNWERDPHDWYVEPPEATEALLRVERFVGKVWDPACGQGNICRTIHASGMIALGTDKVRRIESAIWWRGESDFLAEPHALAPNIVSNPPFFRAAGAEAFIRKALALASSKVAMFLDIRFIAGAERANGLFKEHPPHRIWIITPRVSCPPGSYLAAGNKAGNGSSDWCWMVWDQTAPRVEFPHLGWLHRVSKCEGGKE